MKVAIMQPYILPYIGYFQLIASVDKFVIYDNIKYTKKGWINRNRMLQNGTDKVFSIPLANGSDSLDIVNRQLSSVFSRDKLLNQFRGNYAKAPYFKEVWPTIESIISFQDDNLFLYIKNSITAVCDYLDINSEILVSSSIDADHELDGEDRVVSICHKMEAATYINPIGGVELYSKEYFSKAGLELQFLKTGEIVYDQGCIPMVQYLSILDVLMFNPLDRVKSLLSSNYELI